jgi:hypothetical protein
MRYNQQSATVSNAPVRDEVHKTCVVMVGDGDISLFEKSLGGVPHPFLPSYTCSQHCMDGDEAERYLESNLASGTFDRLMLVGEMDDLYGFRKKMSPALRDHVVAEIIRPSRASTSTDAAMEAVLERSMCFSA